MSKQKAPSKITSLASLKDYMKFYGLKSMIGHPVWHEDDHVLENVAVKFTVDYDKDYSQYALTWWSVG